MRLSTKLYSLLLIAATIFCFGCEEQSSHQYSKGVYLLLDTSGTYTKELQQARQVINIILADLQPGDTLAVARIDSGSFSEKDIIAKIVMDGRPSMATHQKLEFAKAIEEFVGSVKSSPYTDISGGLLQAVEYLNEAKVGNKTILIYSDLQEELPKGFSRDFEIHFNGFEVKALNVTKLRADNRNPQEYLDRLSLWNNVITSGGGTWGVINDLDKPEAITF